MGKKKIRKKKSASPGGGELGLMAFTKIRTSTGSQRKAPRQKKKSREKSEGLTNKRRTIRFDRLKSTPIREGGNIIRKSRNVVG